MLTRYHLAINNFNNSGKILLRSTISGIAMLLEPRIYEQLKLGGPFPLPGGLDAGIVNLLKKHFIVNNPVTDTQQVLAKISRKVEQEELVAVTLMTTGNCNMNCRYCFQNNLITRRGDFPDELISPFVEWIIHDIITPKTRRFMMHFYGGEPLQNMPVIEKIVRSLRPILFKRKIIWDMSLTTNGSLLTKEIANKLAQMGCNLAIISLDGTRETHNYRRPLKHNPGFSFEKVLEGINNGLRCFPVMVRTNIDKQNVNDISLMIDKIVRNYAATPHFFFNIEVVGPVMYPQAHHQEALMNQQEAGDAVKKLLHIQAQRGIKIFGNMPSEVSCEHIMKNAYTVDHDGKIFPCPGFVGFPDFELGDVQKGIKAGFFNSLYAHRPWENSRCLKCTYLPQCHGGCRSCAVIMQKKAALANYNSTYCRKEFFDITFPTFLESLYKDTHAGINSSKQKTANKKQQTKRRITL